MKERVVTRADLKRLGFYLIEKDRTIALLQGQLADANEELKLLRKENGQMQRQLCSRKMPIDTEAFTR